MAPYSHRLAFRLAPKWSAAQTFMAVLEIAQRWLCNDGMIALADGFERLDHRLRYFQSTSWIELRIKWTL